MSARQNLAGILEQWLKLTQAESAAIQSARWPVLKQIHARKTALRQSLAEAVGQCKAEYATVPRDLLAQVRRIISLLTRNGQALAARRRQAQVCQEALDQTKRNLLRIRRSYTQPPVTARWHSYS
jgi:glycerol-3-phosphate dehydrogenase